MELHFATVWEAITDQIGDVTALVHGDVRRSWSEFDDRSARLASAFVGAGLGPDSKIGLYLYNGNEYLEAQYAAFKMRGVAVNVNYRYLDDELWYLLDNADAEALVFHSSLADRVARVIDRLPKLKLLVEVDDGDAGRVPLAHAFETVVAGHDPMARITRNEDDIYMLYTGGTTGMPKGVMYAVGGMTAGYLTSGFPLLGLPVPASPAEVGTLVKQATRVEQPPDLDPVRAAHARHRASGSAPSSRCSPAVRSSPCRTARSTRTNCSASSRASGPPTSPSSATPSRSRSSRPSTTPGTPAPRTTRRR